MRVLSLFSGVEGLGMGLESAGYELVGMCEIDPWCRQVLARHWPDVPVHDDVRTFDGKVWNGRVDLVAGGSPCQDLSMAGRRAGLGGERSGLFWHQCRIAAESAARWILWENVAGTLSSNDGRDFAAVLWGFTGVWPDVPEDGWRSVGVCVGDDRVAVWRLLDAQWCGVAQSRRRVFVVVGPRGECGPEVLLDGESCPRGPRPSRQTGSSVAALTSHGVGTCGVDDNQAQAGHLVTSIALKAGGAASIVHSTPELSHTLTSTQIGVFARTHRATSTTDPDIWAETDVAPTLNTNDTAAGPARSTILAAYPIAVRGRADGAEMELGAPDAYNALRAGDGGSSRQQVVLTPELTVRRLTPLECERLMGWPDNHTAHTATGQLIADCHRYRMCGNGVATPVAVWLGGRLPA